MSSSLIFIPQDFCFLQLFRYLAIIFPLKHCWWRGSHTNHIICIIWILSLMTASPLLYYASAVPFNYSGLALYDCREEWEGELTSRIYTVILFIIAFIIPFIWNKNFQKYTTRRSAHCYGKSSASHKD